MDYGSHFPTLSSDGASVVAGDTHVLLNGEDIGVGRQPVLQANGTIVCAGADWGVLHYRKVDRAWAAEDLAPDSRPNVFRCNQYGQYAYYTNSGGYPRIIDWKGRLHSNYADAAISPGGAIALKHHDTAAVVVIGAVVPGLPAANATSLSWSDAGLFITTDERRDDGLKHPRALFWSDGEPGFADVSLWPDEFAIKAVILNGTRWLLTAANETLLLRPLGSTRGYVLPSMQNADIAFHKTTGRFRIVGADNGALVDIEIDPVVPRRELGPASTSTSVPVPAPSPVIVVVPPSTPAKPPVGHQPMEYGTIENRILPQLGIIMAKRAEQGPLTNAEFEKEAACYGRICFEIFGDHRRSESDALAQHAPWLARELSVEYPFK